MTVVLTWPSQDHFEQRWAAWIARGQAGDARMVFRMRLVFIVAAAGALWAGAIL
jgi:hypothetical protein